MSFTYHEVIWIMCWGYLNNTCSKLFINIFVCNNCYFGSCCWNVDLFSVNINKSLIIWMNHNCTITKHCFRSSSCDCQATVTFYKWICDVVKCTLNVLMFNLNIRKSSLGLNIPVDNPFSTVNIPFIVKIYEYFIDSF